MITSISQGGCKVSYLRSIIHASSSPLFPVNEAYEGEKIPEITQSLLLCNQVFLSCLLSRSHGMIKIFILWAGTYDPQGCSDLPGSRVEEQDAIAEVFQFIHGTFPEGLPRTAHHIKHQKCKTEKGIEFNIF